VLVSKRGHWQPGVSQHTHSHCSIAWPLHRHLSHIGVATSHWQPAESISVRRTDCCDFAVRPRHCKWPRPLIPHTLTSYGLRHRVHSRAPLAITTSSLRTLSPRFARLAAMSAASSNNSSASSLLVPPARDIPNTFFASAKSWWAAGDKQSAYAEERLLR
jgi:hypothetical protein